MTLDSMDFPVPLGKVVDSATWPTHVKPVEDWVVTECYRPLSILSAMGADAQSKVVRRQPGDLKMRREWAGDVLLLRQEEAHD